MNPLPEELKKLNEDLFRAENKESEIGDRRDGWEAFLKRVLADDFTISRASRKNFNKKQMITQVREDKRSRNPPTKIGGGVAGDIGVVTSIITVKDDPNEYHNLKVFYRQVSGGWQCVYWRATKLTGQ